MRREGSHPPSTPGTSGIGAPTAPGGRPSAALALLLAVALVVPACSPRRLAVRSLGGALADGSSTFATDDDPELVGQALPFALKTIEMLLASAPEDRRLLAAASSGFTQYAWAFVEVEAERVEAEDWAAAGALEERASRLYRRAREHGLAGLAVSHPGIGDRLLADPEAAVADLVAADVELAYWTAAAWGSQISLGLDRPELVADLPAVRALLERVTVLDPGFDRGAAHEALATLTAATVPGSAGLAAAAEGFDRAEALARGARAGLFVARAEALAVPRQDRDAYAGLLQRALEVDPDAVPEERLANLINQRRARLLLERIDERFLPPVDGEEEDLP